MNPNTHQLGAELRPAHRSRPAAYWDAVERGEDSERLKRRGPNPLWDVITRARAAP